MNPTTEKIQIGQNDYNNLADWAKPNYQVQQNPVASTVPLQQPQSAIPATALQPTPAIKVPQSSVPDSTSGAIIGSTKGNTLNVVSYRDNPDGTTTNLLSDGTEETGRLTPNPDGSYSFNALDSNQPSVNTALQNFNQAQGAVGTQAEDARANLTNQAETLFTQRANAQANQVNLENQLGLQEQQKALSQINSEIANEQIALRGEQEKIRQGYGTEAQKAISFNTLNDTYGRRLADLAIRQSAANQNITAIQTNAERQTKLLTAPLDTKIQFLSTFAKDNVDYLDKKQSEKLAFLVDDLKTQKQDIQALQKIKTDLTMEIANNGGGANTQLIARLQAAKTPEEASAIAASSGYVGKLDRQLKQAQLSKIYTDMANDKLAQQLANGENTANLQAYANEFNQTGKIPSATDLAKAGVTVAQVTQYAKQLPKQTGAIIDRNTGVKSSNLGDTQLAGIQAIYDIRNKVARMKQLDDVRVKGLSGGLVSKVTGSAIESEYVALQKEVVDLLARARTGAALTADEEAFYKKQLPGRFSNIAGLGTSSSKKLANFDKNMTGTLESKLNSSGLAIQGYSQAIVHGYGSQVIGTVLDIGGSQYRVLPDGTLTDIIQ